MIGLAPALWSRRRFCVAAAATAASPALARERGETWFVFSYFKNADDGRAGMRLALSSDGRRFRPLNGGDPVLVPQVGEDRLLRDPCVFTDPRTGRFHAVWTTGWGGTTIGHASSPDLVNWGPQQAIPVMSAFAGTRNCWAPEGIFDARRKHFVLFWASTVDGAFPETRNPTGKPRNHRIYRTTTTDFRTFTPTALMYEPGFNVIDATLLRAGSDLYLFVKDETEVPVRKFIQWCKADTPLGPYGALSAPITPAWTEGPTAYRSNGEIVVLFDRYRENRFGAVASSDMRTWHDISDQIELPAQASHGTVVPVDAWLGRRLSAVS
jgi:hypothetical protein